MRDTSPAIENAARRLRREMTPAERCLWKALRKNRQEGFYFRRQHPMGRFVVDFCCTSRKLCIEVDGDIHDEQPERDAERTAWLESAGYRVLRFRNEEVLDALHVVVKQIQAALHGSADGRKPASDLPRNGGGGSPRAAGWGAAAAEARHAGPGLLDIPFPDTWDGR
ncbi:MAG TPA: endonuclease domain-containing protein [Longimicrobium sp.]|nr:endonuclease domain-containing protein [Longimicrobium sp.]